MGSRGTEFASNTKVVGPSDGGGGGDRIPLIYLGRMSKDYVLGKSKYRERGCEDGRLRRSLRLMESRRSMRLEVQNKRRRLENLPPSSEAVEKTAAGTGEALKKKQKLDERKEQLKRWQEERDKKKKLEAMKKAKEKKPFIVRAVDTQKISKYLPFQRPKSKMKQDASKEKSKRGAQLTKSSAEAAPREECVCVLQRGKDAVAVQRGSSTKQPTSQKALQDGKPDKVRKHSRNPNKKAAKESFAPETFVFKAPENIQSYQFQLLSPKSAASFSKLSCASFQCFSDDPNKFVTQRSEETNSMFANSDVCTEKELPSKDPGAKLKKKKTDFQPTSTRKSTRLAEKLGPTTYQLLQPRETMAKVKSSLEEGRVVITEAEVVKDATDKVPSEQVKAPNLESQMVALSLVPKEMHNLTMVEGPTDLMVGRELCCVNSSIQESPEQREAALHTQDEVESQVTTKLKSEFDQKKVSWTQSENETASAADGELTLQIWNELSNDENVSTPQSLNVSGEVEESQFCSKSAGMTPGRVLRTLNTTDDKLTSQVHNEAELTSLAEQCIFPQIHMNNTSLQNCKRDSAFQTPTTSCDKKRDQRSYSNTEKRASGMVSAKKSRRRSTRRHNNKTELSERILKTPEQWIKVLEHSPMVEMTRRTPKFRKSIVDIPRPIMAFDDAENSSCSPCSLMVSKQESKEEEAVRVCSDKEWWASHFRKLLSSESERLSSLCDTWNHVSSGMPEDVEGQILAVTGPARLLINDRFKQFSGLVDNFEFSNGADATTADDLRGLWDMIYFQVEDVNKKFLELETLQESSWQNKCTMAVEKKPVKRKEMAKKTKSKVVGKSNFSEFRANLRKQKKKQQQNLNVGSDSTLKLEPIATCSTPTLIKRLTLDVASPLLQEITLNTANQHLSETKQKWPCLFVDTCDDQNSSHKENLPQPSSTRILRSHRRSLRNSQPQTSPLSEGPHPNTPSRCLMLKNFQANYLSTLESGETTYSSDTAKKSHDDGNAQMTPRRRSLRLSTQLKRSSLVLKQPLVSLELSPQKTPSLRLRSRKSVSFVDTPRPKDSLPGFKETRSPAHILPGKNNPRVSLLFTPQRRSLANVLENANLISFSP